MRAARRSSPLQLVIGHAVTWLLVRPVLFIAQLILRVVSTALRRMPPKRRRRLVRGLIFCLALVFIIRIIWPIASSVPSVGKSTIPAAEATSSLDAESDARLLKDAGYYLVLNKSAPWSRVFELALQRRGYKPTSDAASARIAWIVGCESQSSPSLGCESHLDDGSLFAAGFGVSRKTMVDAIAAADLALIGTICPAASQFYPRTLAVDPETDLAQLDFGLDDAWWVVKKANAVSSGQAGLPIVTDVPLQGLRRLRRTSSLVVQRLVAHPMVLGDGKKYTAQLFVLIASAKPLLALWAPNSVVLKAKSPLGQPGKAASSSNGQALRTQMLASQPAVCLDDVFAHVSALHGSTFVQRWLKSRLESLLRFVLFAAMGARGASASSRRSLTSLHSFCVDVEIDDSLNVWLLDATVLHGCQTLASCNIEATVEQGVRAADFVRRFKRAPKWTARGGVLVDEFSSTTWSLPSKLCGDGYEAARSRRRAHREAVEALVPLDGRPRARFTQRSKSLVKCPICGYDGNEEGQLTCDACGGALPVAQDPLGSSSQSFRSRLRALFEVFDPSRVEAVDALLAKYTGQEEHLIERTRKQYEALKEVSRGRLEFD